MGGNTPDFTVSERDGKLWGQLQGQGPNELIPFGNHTFGASFDPRVRIVFTVENGKATKMTLTQSGPSIEGLRKP